MGSLPRGSARRAGAGQEPHPPQDDDQPDGQLCRRLRRLGREGGRHQGDQQEGVHRGHQPGGRAGHQVPLDREVRGSTESHSPTTDKILKEPSITSCSKFFASQGEDAEDQSIG